MPYLSSNASTLPTLPWVYIDEEENRVYLLNFRKIDDEIEHSIYEAYYSRGDLTNLYFDAEAADYLNIANVKADIFNSNTLVQEILGAKVFQGEQISATAGTANALYSLIDGVYYQYDANNSFTSEGLGHKGLQMVRMPGNARGTLGLPNRFVFDKLRNLEPVSYDFSVFPIVYVATGLDNSSLANSAVIVSFNPEHGYYCNKTLTTTANIHTSLINFLPSISLSASPSTAFADSITTANIVANVTYSNAAAYPSAQTTLHITTTHGFIGQPDVHANSSGNTTLYGMGTPTSETIVVRAGWPNYINVANLNMSVVPGTALGYSNYQFTDPGTFNFVIPAFTKMKVKVWGGGGGGGGSTNGTSGANSSFTPDAGTPVVGGKGTFGSKYVVITETNGDNGTGGTATGGNTNIAGTVGAQAPGPGGGSSGAPGSQYGGAGTRGIDGTLTYIGGHGGTGAYAERIYTASEITGNATIVVGAGGVGGTGAGNGAPGAVIVEWI